MKRILVIFGGCSTEYEVSLVSASAVLGAIDRSRYQVLKLGITRQGEALLFEGEEERIGENRWQEQDCCPATVSMSRGKKELWVERVTGMEKLPFDLAFPILHGKCGEDGTIQGLLELAGIPIAGCGMESSVIGMDKGLAHTLASLAGVRVPKSVILHSAEELRSRQQEILALGLPVFVKPVRAGSSFGISRVTEETGLEKAVREAFCHDAQVVIEENISGFEVGCAVLGNRELTLGRVDEIQLQEGFFDYEEKYTLKTSAIHMPARISSEEEEKIRSTAKTIYQALGCKGFARVDLFYTPEKEIVFNEVNTIPGFTGHSRFPNMMKGIGLEFFKLVEQIIELAE